MTPFLLIILLLFSPIVSSAQTPFRFSPEQGLKSLGAPNPESPPYFYSFLTTTRPQVTLSIVAGTAFINVNTLTIYGSANGYTKVSIFDGGGAGGQSLVGYLKAPGTAETYGPNTVLLNPTFDVDVANWTGSNGTIASVAGGVGGTKALQLTRTSGTIQIAFQNTNATSGMLYRASGYVKSGTSGNESSFVQIKNGAAPFAVLGASDPQLSSAAWAQFPYIYGTLGQTYVLIQYSFAKNTGTAGTMLFDEANLTQVLTPSPQGATVVDAPGSATFNWTSEGATFNRNDSSYFFRIIRTR